MNVEVGVGFAGAGSDVAAATGCGGVVVAATGAPWAARRAGAGLDVGIVVGVAAGAAGDCGGPLFVGVGPAGLGGSVGACRKSPEGVLVGVGVAVGWMTGAGWQAASAAAVRMGRTNNML